MKRRSRWSVTILDGSLPRPPIIRTAGFSSMGAGIEDAGGASSGFTPSAIDAAVVFR